MSASTERSHQRTFNWIILQQKPIRLSLLQHIFAIHELVCSYQWTPIASIESRISNDARWKIEFRWLHYEFLVRPYLTRFSSRILQHHYLRPKYHYDKRRNCSKLCVCSTSNISSRTTLSSSPTRLSGEENWKLFFNPFMVSSIIFSSIFHMATIAGEAFDDKTIIPHNSFRIFLGIFPGSSPPSSPHTRRRRREK